MTPADQRASRDHPVVREVWHRREHQVKANSPDAETRLALVVEGGGMRGVFSAGMMLGMAELGLTEVFDRVYGESAGAPNCCYFLSGQGALGIRIYSEDLTSSKFANPFRIGRMINVDYVVDEVIAKVKALDVERVLRSPSDLFLSVTHGYTGVSRMIDVKREGVPLLTVLRASAAIVPLYNRFVEIQGEPYADGGIGNPIPVRSAIEDGCTHILVLLTQPMSFAYERIPWWHRAWMKPLGRNWTPAFTKAFYENHAALYNRSRDLAFGRAAAPPGVQIAYLAPDKAAPAVGRATIDKAVLLSAVENAKRCAREAFSGLTALASSHA